MGTLASSPSATKVGRRLTYSLEKIRLARHRLCLRETIPYHTILYYTMLHSAILHFTILAKSETLSWFHFFFL